MRRYLFFHRYAGQNQFRHIIGVSYVAVKGAENGSERVPALGRKGREATRALLPRLTGQAEKIGTWKRDSVSEAELAAQHHEGRQPTGL